MKFILQFAFVLVNLYLVNGSKYRPAGTKISDYENYLEDLSPIGKDIRCTEAEKECYKLRRVLYSDGKCYMVSHVGPCGSGLELHLNKDRAQTGEFVSECMPSYKCGDAMQRYMSFDQTCYLASLTNEVCDFKRNLSYSNDIFGGGHCRCFGDGCPPRPEVKQPEEEGRCRLPDLIWTSFPYWEDPLRDRVIPCSVQEHECFKQGKALHLDGSCYPLLERGPCNQEEWFTVNKTAFQEQGWLLGACGPSSCSVTKRAERFVRMQSDGKCYKYDVIENMLCPPHKVVFDVFGDASCGWDEQKDVGKQLPIIVTQSGECRGRYIRF